MIREVLTLSRLAAMPADEAAALWAVRLADGEFPHERELFEEWLDLAPPNREAWQRAESAWKVFESAQDDELLDEMLRYSRDTPPARSHDWRRYAAGIALLVAVAGSSIVAERGGVIGRGERSAGAPSSQSAPIVEASYSYSTGRELPRRIVLTDGSAMTLDAESKVTAVFSPQRRSLRLVSGRAFFDVRHEAARPFIVNAMNVETVDIGTRFEVGLKGTDVRVILLDGRVAVTPHGAARTMLAPGEQLVARNGAAPVVSRTAGDEALSWQTGFAAFDNDTLSEAAALLNRYPGDEILVRDPRVAAMRISGNFKIGDAERFGRTLEQIYPVRVIRRSEHQIEIVAA